MGKLYKFILPSLFFILIGTIGFSIYYSRSIDKTIMNFDSGLLGYNKLPEYHFFVILPNSDEPYLKDLVNGLQETASKDDVALEINYTNSSNDYNDTLRLIKIAITSNVNGIITQGFNTPEFKQLISEAKRKNIPVVSLDPSTTRNDTTAYVGTNGFEMGFKEGNMVIEATKGHARVAMVLEEGIDSYGNAKLQGFKEAIKNYKDIQIVATKISEPGILGAHNITQEIISKYPQVNTIVCTTSKDTIGVAQIVIDFNKVGEISIIGYDKSPEILSYIQKGIIYGTIVPNFQAIGTKSIKYLMDVKKNGKAINFIDADSQVITQNNIDKMTKK